MENPFTRLWTLKILQWTSCGSVDPKFKTTELNHQEVQTPWSSCAPESRWVHRGTVSVAFGLGFHLTCELGSLKTLFRWHSKTSIELSGVVYTGGLLQVPGVYKTSKLLGRLHHHEVLYQVSQGPILESPCWSKAESNFYVVCRPWQSYKSSKNIPWEFGKSNDGTVWQRMMGQSGKGWRDSLPEF